jgi:putative flippase GtrA
LREIQCPALQVLWKSQKARFLAVGAFNTFTGFSIFVVLTAFIGENQYLLVGLMSHVFSTTISFALNRNFVFGKRSVVALDYFRFQLAYTMILLTNLVVLTAFVELLKWPVLFSQSICLPFVAAASYLGHKYFSFRN